MFICSSRGNTIRGIERLTGVCQETILNLLVEVGNGCKEFSRRRIRAVPVQDLQLDEAWTFVLKKERRKAPDERKRTDIGDQFVFIALERNTKLVVCWHLGRRDNPNTWQFVNDLRNATSGTFQVSSDAFSAYKFAIETGLHDRADYAQLIKLYGRLPGDRGDYYRPAKIKGTISAPIMGNPDEKRVCTSHVERKNATLRHWCRRFTRLTCAFSKKRGNLEAALALHFAYYNFCRIHSTIKVTPAIENGLTDHVWTLDELLEEAVG